MEVKMTDNEVKGAALETKESQEKINTPAQPAVLVVDDDKNILKSFKMLLDSENIEMIAASNAEEAMEKIKGRRLNLIITDFMLETKSSVELFTLIKKQYTSVPIAVITGYPELVSEKDIKMFGANYFLTKPLELGNLRTLIRNTCL
jgi:DNA-binding NtrC family response regulator